MSETNHHRSASWVTPLVLSPSSLTSPSMLLMSSAILDQSAMLLLLTMVPLSPFMWRPILAPWMVRGLTPVFLGQYDKLTIQLSVLR